MELNTQNIKDLLYDKKITHTKAARMIGISESGLAHRLRGKIKFNHHDIFGILKILDMPFEKVFKLK